MWDTYGNGVEKLKQSLLEDAQKHDEQKKIFFS